MKLTRAEADWLLTRLGDDPHRLRIPLLQIIQGYDDAATKLAEITARANACAHFAKEYSTISETRGPKKTKRKRKRMELVVDSIPEDRREALLAAGLRAIERRAMEGDDE